MNTLKIYCFGIFFIFFSDLMFSQSTVLQGKILSEKNAVAFVNVALFSAADTALLIKGTVSDMQGNYKIANIEKDNYLLKVSFVGYKYFQKYINLRNYTTDFVTQDIVLVPDTVLLNEMLVKGKLKTIEADKVTYTFTNSQKAQAREAMELLANVHGIYIDKAENSIAAISGKSIMLLINGVASTDIDLKLIPADKIKRVDYYDIPPARYMNNAEIVIDIITKELDSGWAGDVYMHLGQMYSYFQPALSHVTGRHKFTLEYGGHINHKRKIQDTENGIYQYNVNNNPYSYIYEQKYNGWGNQNSLAFTYSNSKESAYVFQIEANTSINASHLTADKTIQIETDGKTELTDGQLSDNTRTFSPSLDVYYSKNLSENSKLTMDIVGTLFRNSQQSKSNENGINGFEDVMNLAIDKRSIIGETVYEHKMEKVNFTVGYRGIYNYLTNRLQNSSPADAGEDKIQTQSHYVYAEIVGRFSSFTYKFGAGYSGNFKFGEYGFKNHTFIPIVIAGYNINTENSIRAMFTSGATMPNIQQMSANRILLMKNFYKTGNSYLTNSVQNSYKFLYDYSGSWLNLQTNLFFDNSKNYLFDNYLLNNDFVELKTENANKYERYGVDATIDLTPLKWLNISGNVELAQNIFKPTDEASTVKYLSCIAALYASFEYKKFSLAFMQRFGGHSLDGLYKTGIEKASNIDLSYTYKNLEVGVRCLFPFAKDKFTRETIIGNIVYHKTDTHLRRKDRTFGIYCSWNFNTSKKQNNVDKDIQNSDSDKGIFEVK